MRKVLLLSLFLLFSLIFFVPSCALKEHQGEKLHKVSAKRRIKNATPIKKVKNTKKVGNVNKKVFSVKKRKTEKPKEELNLTKEQRLLLENLITPEEAKPSIWPVIGIITSKFHWRHRKFHAGVDIATDYGTPIVASAPGKVIYTGYRHGYGYMVVIYHGYGYTTVYAHLSGIDVKEGDLVDRGRVIGFVGATGRATGPHLHYEVLKYGVRQDPMIYLP